jgi:hypothetical protein
MGIEGGHMCRGGRGPGRAWRPHVGVLLAKKSMCCPPGEVLQKCGPGCVDYCQHEGGLARHLGIHLEHWDALRGILACMFSFRARKLVHVLGCM